MTVGIAVANLPTPTILFKGIEQIFVQAPSTNTGIIFLGKAGVLSDYSTGAFEISSGANMNIPTNLWDQLFAIATLANQKLFVTYLRRNE